MPSTDSETLKAAEALERDGDALAACGEACAQPYRDAQALLMPAGRAFDDRAAHDRRMAAFARLQQKLYALGPGGRPRGAVAPPTVPPAKPAAPQGDAPPPEPWRAPALAGRLTEAVELLHGEVHGLGGMGFYAAEGYRLEAMGDTVAADDAAAARRHYEAALKSYLCYVLMPARGDSEAVGYGLAEAVLVKLAAVRRA